MENKNLIKALRDEFAPRIRELCADDKFDCDKLCAGNILTAQCIVFQAADALESQVAEIADLRTQLAEKDEQLKAAESRMNKAFAVANNAIYFADSSDYCPALCDCGVALFPEVDEYDIGKAFIDESGPQEAEQKRQEGCEFCAKKCNVCSAKNAFSDCLHCDRGDNFVSEKFCKRCGHDLRGEGHDRD